MMEYESLEDARSLLILLELIHDYIMQSNSSHSHQYRSSFGTSLRKNDISEYAASVISKINTLTLIQGQQQKIASPWFTFDVYSWLVQWMLMLKC